MHSKKKHYNTLWFDEKDKIYVKNIIYRKYVFNEIILSFLCMKIFVCLRDNTLS